MKKVLCGRTMGEESLSKKKGKHEKHTKHFLATGSRETPDGGRRRRKHAYIFLSTTFRETPVRGMLVPDMVLYVGAA